MSSICAKQALTAYMPSDAYFCLADEGIYAVSAVRVAAISAEEAERLLMGQGWDGRTPLLGLAVINPFCWPVRASLKKWLRGKLTGDLSGQYDKWYFFSYSRKRREAYDRYLTEIAKAANAFMREKYYFPVLIGMEQLDAKACRTLEACLERPAAIFLSGNCSADVMTGVLRRLDALVTSRYHAAVLSMEGAVPVVAISMDERLEGIMKELGLDEKYLLRTKDHDLGNKLYRALTNACAERDVIRARIKKAVPRYKKKLDEMGTFMKKYLR